MLIGISSTAIKKIPYDNQALDKIMTKMYDLSIIVDSNVLCPMRRYRNIPSDGLKLVDF
jgi:hypothetical protein